MGEVNKLEGVQRNAARFVWGEYRRGPGTKNNYKLPIYKKKILYRRVNADVIMNGGRCGIAEYSVTSPCGLCVSLSVTDTV